MNIEVLKCLEKVKAFQYVDKKFLAEIAYELKILKFSSGQDIITFGDNTGDAYINFAGVLEVTYLLQEGKKVTFDIIAANRFFGEISSIDGKIRSATITALTDVTLVNIPCNYFRDVLLNNVDFTRGLLNECASRIRSNNQQIVHLASADSMKKTVIQLLRLSKLRQTAQGSIKLVEGVSHEMIASFVGLSRETVSRMISASKKEGLITDTSKGNIVLDVEKISNFIQMSEDEVIDW